MRTLTYQLRDLKKFMICIGFEDENNRTQVRIDCGEVFAEYPNAAVTMKVQAPKGGIYPATVAREDDVILWTVRDCDVANKGSGEFQLTFTDGTTVVKTCVGKFHVDRSLKGSGTAPSGVQDWLDHAEDVLEQVESAEIHQPMIGLDGYWYKWDQEAGEYVSTGTKAQGQDGQPGTDATPDLITKDYADLSFPVAKDSFCYHDGKLYQAKQAIQTAEDWTAAHWQETTVEEKITDITSEIQDKIDKPTTAGTAGQVLVSDGNGGQVWGTTGQGTIVVDDTLSVSGAAADAAKVGDLKSAIKDTSECADNGNILLLKNIVWQPGYVNSIGLVKSSTLSQFALVKMNKGEKLKIGTANSNIAIIASTENNSVTVGDTITVIQTTTNSGQYEEYEYTAENEINIVVSVRASNYNIMFFRPSAYIKGMKSDIDRASEELFTNYELGEIAEETVSVTSGTAISASNTKVYVDLSEGESIKFSIESENIIAKYVLYINGSMYATYIPNVDNYITLNEDVTNISFYVDANDAIGTGSIVFSISRANINNNSVQEWKKLIPNAITEGFVFSEVVANGSFNSSTGVTTGATNRIRTALIPFKKYDKIVIENGSFLHACGIWNGEPSSSTNTRNDSTFSDQTETIVNDYDGYIVIVFKLSSNTNISPNDFDGIVKLFNTMAYRAYANKYAEDKIPAYYYEDSYLAGKTSRINTLGKTSDDVFVFITDIHWERNAQHSCDLIEYLSENCSIYKIFDCGDVANGSALQVYKKYRNSIDGKTYHIVGNHELFSPTNAKELYYGMDSGNNEQIGNAFEHYWYVDNVQQKIRYVVLNSFSREEGQTTVVSGYDAAQITWFEGTALNLPSPDWDVIVFTHYLKTSAYITGGSDIGNAIDTFNASEAHTGKVLAVFQGHTHWDGIYHTNGGVPIITTTCDKWDLSNESDIIPSAGIAFRELGTLTEQAFDVVILNRSEKKFTCVRIGAPAQDNIDKYRTDTGFTWIGTLEEREISYGEE